MQTQIEITRGDITKLEVDAIVNAANTSLLGGGGVDGAIHRAGGPVILKECRIIIARQGGCKTGEAVMTGAGLLPAKFVIHTVGPVWNGGYKNEARLLAACYQNSLFLANENNCKTIAFPNISTGIYGFPKELATAISFRTVYDFINTARSKLDKLVFVCFDEENYSLLHEQLSQTK